MTLAEERLAKAARRCRRALPAKLARAAEIAPILRGAVAICRDERAGTVKRQILDFRTSPAILSYVNGAELERYTQQGVVTPDHTIRTKNWPLLVPAPEAGKLDDWKKSVEQAVDKFVAHYHAYFARNNARAEPKKTELDPLPRVILVPGVGLFGLGASAKDAAIAADIAENTVEVITDAEAIGRYQPISEADMFDVEYWSLEQAKLGKAAEKALARQVAIVTGGGSGIGAATAKALARAGAEVAVLDRDLAAAQAVAEIGQGPGARLRRDQCRRRARGLRRGGEDIRRRRHRRLQCGRGVAGHDRHVDDATLRQSFELNFFAHQTVAQNAVRIMHAQGTGGCLLFNTSKQAVNPGKDFGPYGLPKASTLFLMKQYALDHGKDGIRSNAVNADRIRSGLLTDDMIASRSKARGVSRGDYMSNNLVGREVTADDVADAFVYLATAQKTTAAILTVDGGNIEASLRGDAGGTPAVPARRSTAGVSYWDRRHLAGTP